MVNLELYKIFAIVAEEQNITRAGEKLYLTQPAITKHIKKLEDMLQVNLFIRSNHGIILTKEGQDLYGKIKESIDLLTNIEKTYYKTRDINLGTHTTLLNKIFSKCLSEYYKENPKSKINTRNDDNEQMLLKLKSKELDIIFSKKMHIKKGYENIKFIKLGELNDVLIVNKASKWKDKKIAVKDIENATIYMPRKTSETPRNFFESVNCIYEDFKDIKNITYETIFEVVKNNDVIALVTKEFMSEENISKDFYILDTEFKIKPIEFGIYINKDNMFEDLKSFIKVIKRYFCNK